MEKYQYRVSVIVPVYNVEAYVSECLDSLLSQTMPQKDMEILVINDGSTDSSYEICRKYAAENDCIKLFSKANEGLSATRNYGIRRACGKYLMYIDSDDKFTPDTLLRVADFFDSVYDEVDLVTYFEQPYSGDDYSITPHTRYKYFLRKTGIYDLEKQPFIVQTRVNVAVKNRFEDNIFFDETPGFKQEDQEYNNRILKDKLKLGYVKEACYMYNRGNEGSIVATSFHAYYLFEKSMPYFERLFSMFPDKVPQYFQAMFVHDLRWKLQSKILFPYHYEKPEFDRAVSRIRALLRRCDTMLIAKAPTIPAPIKYFLIRLKDDADMTVYVSDSENGLLTNGVFCWRSNRIEVCILGIQVTDENQLIFRSYIKSPLLSYLPDGCEVYVCENNDREHLKKLELHKSAFSYAGTSQPIQDYCGCEYICDPKNAASFYHLVKIDGVLLPVSYTFLPQAVFKNRPRQSSFIRANTRITFSKQVFYLKKMSESECVRFEKHQTRVRMAGARLAPVRRLRLEAIEYRRHHRIWLYSDLYTVEKDNGYYQFINDFHHQDGIERYYVCTRPVDEVSHLFTPQQQKFLVPFGSDLHKKLYLAADLIFSAFYGRTPISPFPTEKEEFDYYGIEHFKVIYLQHGVLHASLRVQNSAENVRADKVVISSPFEKKNYHENYYYRPEDLLETSMARYDHIDRTGKAENRILFAPSWRNYLAASVTASSWSVQRGKIVNSDYYKNILKFVNSDALIELLEKYDMQLELKLHPIISSAKDLFSFRSDRIKMAAPQVNLADYRIFMTDFSSFLFDYAPLVRPILYFVPDYPQFKSGMSHYRDLDLPFEEAFGPLSLTAEEAVSQLEKVLQNDCEPEPVYRNRMENFFYPLDNCAERLYQHLQQHPITRHAGGRVENS